MKADDFRKRTKGDALRRGANLVPVNSLVKEAGRAYLVALRVSGSATLAEEAVQEAYVQLVKKPPVDLGYEQSVSYFLIMARSIANNQIRGLNRRKKREEVHAMTAETTSPAPEGAAIDREVIEALRNGLAAIQKDEREAVSLCCEQGMTQRVAGKILGVPEQTISDRVRRGLSKLRTLLVAQGYGAMAPLGGSELGAALLKGGIPDVPPTLMLRVESIVGDVANSSRVAAVSDATMKLSSLWIGLVLCGVLGAGWWIREEAAIPALKPEAVDSGQKLKLTVKIRPREQRKNVIKHWDFLKGPSNELSLSKGKWAWELDKTGKSGGMVAKNFIVLKLPVPVPSTPIIVEVQAVSLGKHSAFSAKLTGEIDGRGWRKLPNMVSGNLTIFSGYFLEEAAYVCTLNGLHSIDVFNVRKSEEQFVLKFDGWKIRSIIICHADQNESHRHAPDIEDWKKKLIAKSGR